MDSFFWFRKEEFRGVMVVLLLGTALALLASFVQRRTAIEAISPEQKSRLMALWLQDSLAKAQSFEAKRAVRPNKGGEESNSSINWSLQGAFNPNNATDQDWLSRGLSEKQVRSINKYCSKGARFYSLEDLKKVYVLSDEWVDFFADDFVFPIPERKEQSKPRQKEDRLERDETIIDKAFEREQQRVNINIADTTALMEIRGIGSYYANKLVNYRNALGGFHDMTQFKELYNIREETLLILENSTFIDRNQLQCLPINSASAEELAQHPYLSRNQSKALVAFRTEHGAFQVEQDLLKCVVISEELLEKIRPYLCLKTP